MSSFLLHAHPLVACQVLISDRRTFRVYALTLLNFFFVPGATAPGESGPPHYLGFTITFRHTTIGGNPLDE